MIEQDNFTRILNEQWFLLAKVPPELGIKTRRLYHLRNSGLRSLSGKIVKLEAVRTEHGLATSYEAVMRFRERLNTCEDGDAQGSD